MTPFCISQCLNSLLSYKAQLLKVVELCLFSLLFRSFFSLLLCPAGSSSSLTQSLHCPRAALQSSRSWVPGHHRQSWPCFFSAQPPPGFHDSTHFLVVLFPAGYSLQSGLSEWGCALGLSSGPPCVPTLISYTISSIPVALRAIIC